MPITPAQICEQNIVKVLRHARQQQNISYEKLAGMTGLHRTALSLIEREKRHVSLINCIKIAKALNCDIFNKKLIDNPPNIP